MSTSTNYGRSGRSDGRPAFDWLDGLSRYDLALLVIPLSFLLSLATASVLAVSLHQAVLVAGLFGLAVLIDAVYLNPPTGGSPGAARP